MWVMVLEKAWAKLFKSYERTNGGMTERTVMSLTGAPYEIMYDGRGSWVGIWEKMKAYDEKDYMMGACIFARGMSDSNKSPMGLVYGHAYAVL
jgi:calpain-15